MLPSAIGATYFYFRLDAEGSATAFQSMSALLISAGIGTVIGGLLVFLGRSGGQQLGRKEALLLVSLSWVVGAALAALPFRLWDEMAAPTNEQGFNSYVNCYFEAMSGLTTTGSSVLSNIEALPKSLLLWRAFIQWLGGIGIVVLFVAVLPILGVGGKRLFKFEAPGPKKEGVRPRIRAAAQMLWIIYVCITIVEILALRIGGLGWFDALCHSLTTLATGGFSTKNASVTGLGGWHFEVIIMVFMFLAGVNFGLYDQLINGQWRAVLKNPELRTYVGIIGVASVLIAVPMIGSPIPTMNATEPDIGIWHTIRHSMFTVISLQTTTGFGTADYDQWSGPSQALLVTLMFVGGCAGSTGGGIKVIRFVILVKVLVAEIQAVFRPYVVQTIRVGRTVIDHDLRSATLVFFLLYGVLVVVGTVGVLAFEPPGELGATGVDASISAFSAVAATLNNIGPGLGHVGPTHNFAHLTSETKILLSILMAMGRLELFAFVVLFVPAFWREE